MTPVRQEFTIKLRNKFSCMREENGEDEEWDENLENH